MRTVAAILRDYNTRFEVTEIELDKPMAGEVLVRMGATGLCHSDLHTVTGAMGTKLPAVLGHEGAGVVEEVGPGVSHVGVGDHVVISWMPVCGHCENCLRNIPQQCSTTYDLMFSGGLEDGSTRISHNDEPVYHYSMASTFAKHMVVPAASAVKIPDDISFDVASIVGCAVTTGIGAVWNAAQVKPGDRVAVFGCGGVGMSAILGARAAGAAPIVAVDVNPGKVEKAIQLGATDGVVWQGDPATVAEQVAAAAGGGTDYSIDASGRVEVIEAAFASTRAAGTTVLVGIAGADEKVSFPARLIPRTERRIIGSFYGTMHPEKAFPLILGMHQRGQLPLRELVSHTLTLENINDGFDLMRSGDTIRAVIDLSD